MNKKLLRQSHQLLARLQNLQLELLSRDALIENEKPSHFWRVAIAVLHAHRRHERRQRLLSREK
jgi:hypothetical protein